MKTLDTQIVEKLATTLKISHKTVKNNVYSLAQKYPGVTPNALAHIYAQQNGKSVLKMLDNEDRKSVPSSSPSINIVPPNQKNFRVVQIGKEPDRWYNNWLIQLIIAFFLWV